MKKMSDKFFAEFDQAIQTYHNDVREELTYRVQCGCCGGSYTIIGKDRYGCATRAGKRLNAELYGDLANILSACAGAQNKTAPELRLAGRFCLCVWEDLVAGTGNHREFSCCI